MRPNPRTGIVKVAGTSAAPMSVTNATPTNSMISPIVYPWKKAVVPPSD